MLDLLVRNGVIVDGTGEPRFQGDLGVKGQRIAAVARRPQAIGKDGDCACPVIDASGLVVAPGFFDIHSHSDRTILTDPLAESALSQGITTVIGGNCGASAAPLNDRLIERLRTAHTRMDPGAPVRPEIDWRSMGEFLGKVESAGAGVNFGMFVGQGTVRAYTIGMDPRGPTAAELDEMQSLVAQAAREGALGLSTGRSYLPGRHASTEEIIALCRPVARVQGLYCTHLRSEGFELFEGLEEAFRIGREAGLPVQIVHLKVYGKPSWGKAPGALRLIERARESGLDVLFDVYPYHYSQVGSVRRAFGASLGAGLSPGEAAEALRNPATVEEIVARETPAVLADPFRLSSLPVMGILWCPNTPEHTGKCLAEAASDLGLLGGDPLIIPDDAGSRGEYVAGLIRAAAGLYVANDGSVKTAGQMHEDEVRLFLRHPLGMFGTDAASIDGTRDLLDTVHPRAYGTYPRILGRYVRDEGLLGLEEAVRKATSLPARRVGVTDRGVLAPGKYADVTVFDAATIADRATPGDPARRSLGISRVVVNGQVAMTDGQPTGIRAGKVLRS